MKDSIYDETFQGNLKKLCIAIEPIHMAQKMSEANGATLSKVIPRQNQLFYDLEAFIPLIPSLQSFIDNQFKARRTTQTRYVH